MAHISCSVCAMQKFIDFIECLMDFCIYNDIWDTIITTDKKLLHFEVTNWGQILCGNNTGLVTYFHLNAKALICVMTVITT